MNLADPEPGTDGCRLALQCWSSLRAIADLQYGGQRIAVFF